MGGERGGALVVRRGDWIDDELKLRTILIERQAPGGQASTSSRIENYLGFPTGVSGRDLTNRALEQAFVLRGANRSQQHAQRRGDVLRRGGQRPCVQRLASGRRTHRHGHHLPAVRLGELTGNGQPKAGARVEAYLAMLSRAGQ